MVRNGASKQDQLTTFVHSLKATAATEIKPKVVIASLKQYILVLLYKQYPTMYNISHLNEIDDNVHMSHESTHM